MERTSMDQAAGFQKENCADSWEMQADQFGKRARLPTEYSSERYKAEVRRTSQGSWKNFCSTNSSVKW